MELASDNIELKGVVDRITYKNSENGYTVIRARVGKELIVATGIMPFLQEGDSVILNGFYTIHPSYGQEFKCHSVEASLPKTQAQVLRFLSSGAIKGIGPVTAEKIVSKFKDKTLDIIENDPVSLTTIKGISIEKARSICEEYKKQFGVRDIMLTLAVFKITPNEAADIFKALGTSAVDIIKANPYILCSEPVCFSFERAEEIAENFGVERDNPNRICAGIKYVLRFNLLNGHTCLPKEKLVSTASRLLGVETHLVLRGLDLLDESLSIVSKRLDGQEFIFLPEYANTESYIANRIKATLKNSGSSMAASRLEILHTESKLGISFDEKQITAINTAVINNISILTGGPGTGKTTTLNGIIDILKNRENSIALTAPTGRAAKRVSELTGVEAKTLHRLLEVEWIDKGRASFARNTKRQLDYDVIIVDEMSMVDVTLFKALLEAMKVSTKLVLVGDSDQLPSVGAGNLLSDLISSGEVPSVRLFKIFRQSEESNIVTAAHEIISGNIPSILKNDTDFFFINSSNPFDTCNKVVSLCKERLPQAFGFSATEDIQILCPSRKMEAGSVNLNVLLQESLNPANNKKEEKYFKGIPFRVGDKVMQIKNDYDIMWTSDLGETGAGIFNGDIGFISAIDNKAGIIKVKYDDKTATYYPENLDLIEHAYAVTVHKSQGSEFECVIIPIIDTPSQLQYRNLLYTAITRAKRLLVLVGSRAIFERMINNDKKTLRYTSLSYLMKGKVQ